MFRFRILLFLAVLSGQAPAQNLLPNPGFEELNDCPHGYGEFAKVNDWFRAGIGSPDLFNVCDGGDTAGAPRNFAGYQWPLSGNSYCGMIAYSNAGPGYGLHEIIGVRLLTPLTVGTTYHVAFHVSWTSGAPNVNHQPRFASNNMGVLCTVDSMTNWALQPLPSFAHVYSDQVITDSLQWTMITGSFMADSAYTFLWVGNFFDDPSTQVVIVDSTTLDEFSYYYVDDVCLAEDSLYCQLWQSLPQPDVLSNTRAFINPKARVITIDGIPTAGRYGVDVINELGQILQAESISGPGPATIHLGTTPVPGVIFLRLHGEAGAKCFKFLAIP